VPALEIEKITIFPFTVVGAVLSAASDELEEVPVAEAEAEATEAEASEFPFEQPANNATIITNARRSANSLFVDFIFFISPF